jgi:hypothetical protein
VTGDRFEGRNGVGSSLEVVDHVGGVGWRGRTGEGGHRVVGIAGGVVGMEAGARVDVGVVEVGQEGD